MNDKQRVEYANWEYSNLDEEDPITIEGKGVVGHVSQVNNKPTGEQSFVITDTYVPTTASVEERSQVKEVTVLYRGSTGLDKTFQEPVDVIRDWLLNDAVTGVQIINGGGNEPVTPQLTSSADTLKNAMAAYPNAKVYVYGHSLGSMNGQYALADLPQEYLSRIEGAYLYQGPNVYSLLTDEQKRTADALTVMNRIFNYVDMKDKIPIGYGMNKQNIGNLVIVDSKKVGAVDQHMWGGYQYDSDGKILTDSNGNMELAKHNVKQQLASIANLRKAFMKSGGGLSSSEEIFLDAAEALAITEGMKQTIQSEIASLQTMYKTGIENAQELWRSALSEASGIGSHLSAAEELSALSSGGATEVDIVTKPVADYETALTKVTLIEKNYNQLIEKIKSAISQQLETDQNLAKQIGSS